VAEYMSVGRLPHACHATDVALHVLEQSAILPSTLIKQSSDISMDRRALVQAKQSARLHSCLLSMGFVWIGGFNKPECWLLHQSDGVWREGGLHYLTRYFSAVWRGLPPKCTE
jgi:hypothetical protein